MGERYAPRALAPAGARPSSSSCPGQARSARGSRLLSKGPWKGPLDPPRASAVGQSPPALTRLLSKGPWKGPLDPPRASAVGQSPPALTRLTRLLKPAVLDFALQLMARPVQPGLDRAFGDAEQVGRLAGRPTLDLAQLEDRAQGRGQLVERLLQRVSELA